MAYGEACRALIRAISVHEKEILRLSDENQYLLAFIRKQPQEVELVEEATLESGGLDHTIFGGEGTTEEEIEDDGSGEKEEGGQGRKKTHFKKQRKEIWSRAVDSITDMAPSLKREVGFH